MPSTPTGHTRGTGPAELTGLTGLAGELAALAGEIRAQPPARDAASAPGTEPLGTNPAAPTVLADRSDGTVVGVGDVVVKAHPPGTDADLDALRIRLHAASHPLLSGILLPPLPFTGPAEPTGPPEGPPARAVTAPSGHRPVLLRQLAGGRAATGWPRGVPLTPDDDPATVPWAATGRLLARLHTVSVRELAARLPGLPGPLPAMGGPKRAAQALSRMRDAFSHEVAAPAHAADAETVERAWATLPAWCRAEEPQPAGNGTLCHGDFHFGQLVACAGSQESGGWRLIDADDLGVGDSAWDLARPAAWFAAGLLPPGIWEGFLGAYCAAGGPAVPPAAPPRVDPPSPPPCWHPALDAPARALTVQSAALAVAKAHLAHRSLNEAERACVDACARIAATARTTAPATSQLQPAEES